MKKKLAALISRGESKKKWGSRAKAETDLFDAHSQY